MYGQGPQRVPRSGEDRLLERLRSIEQRLAGIERRGQSSTWSSAGVAGHAASHATGGTDPLNPSDLGAAEQDDLLALEAALGSLEAEVADKPTSFATTITGDGTETSFVITHSQGTRDLVIAIRENASPWSLIQTGYQIEHSSLDAVTIVFDSAPADEEEIRVIVFAQ
jgi:hypothetical protein